MNQEQFLQELSKALKPLSEEERNEILFDFEEHITEGVKEGRPEANIIRELGSPKQIAKELVPDVTETAPAVQRPKKNLFQMACSAAAISILNLIFVLGPALGIFGVYVGFCGAALALSVSPIMFVSMVMFQMNTHMMLEFFLSLMFGSLGLLSCIGLWHLGKLLYNVSLRYIRYNLKLVTGAQT
ncbi:DUF1700 domain-containing protein [Bacillus spizizenii]|uniref:HAAS signaling domain-containing protein n=1 Tax=Bacillus spizizenii TaxID=96241 RepID=UPI0022807FF2|nr:DUF1700 domain-containing protein [Bacillus spizizenii]MCY7795515.1 DUF1700 domain-containing protein [Bacillus spizizenii]MCY7824099.1 DUF1700 domain-containing protein [Bacillus spizizenii]MCY7896936.1 DUF1700 domain-containing protein [Bacillus spizizenii]MCY8212487.1 DUF1700 domain-containing protein [Bacillus spizizenii]MCY8228166.1 DUF1700 domain-containing protein [Bacillus spizizenii]